LDPTGAVIPNASLRLSSPGTRYDRTLTTDAEGRYGFDNIPMRPFTLHIEAPGFKPAEYSGEIRDTAPILVNIQFKGISSAEQITVVQGNPDIGVATTHVDIDEEQLEKMPPAPPVSELSAVVESVPGVVPEENGRLHVRGSEAQPQYVLDGVPISDNLTGTFATPPDTENLRSTQVITGNLPAEYGQRTAGVINLQSKSGLDMPWNGSVAFSGGSFDSRALDMELGGHVRDIGVFLSADVSRNSRFLDPPEIENLHNGGGLAHLFTRFDWSPSRKDVLHLTLTTDGTDFQVSNLEEQQEEGQRQRQELRSDYEALSWVHTFSNYTTGDVVLFRRSSTARLLDPGFTAKPFFLDQNRRLRNEGVRANLDHEWKWLSLKAGFEARRVPITERFTLAVTDPEDVDPGSPVSEFTLDDPFRFHGTRAGSLLSSYVQGRIRLGEHLTADLGVRWDHPDLVVHDNAISPRLGLAYHIARTGTTLHVSYNRLYQIPPLENLLLATSPDVAELSTEPEDQHTLRGERQNQYQFGFQQQFGKRLQLGVVHYVKNIKNSVDDEQLLETAIVFPVQLFGSDIRGTEVRLDFSPVDDLRAYLSYANARATVSGPIVGGLFLESEEGDAGEFAAGEFPGDQDERNEGQFGVTYTHKSGLWATFNARYDSGIPSHFDPDEFSSFDPRIQAALDPVRQRIKPRTILDIVGGMDLFRESTHPISVQLGVNNLTDRFYLYNFRSVFSGTHIGRPREVVARIEFHWSARH
jgi:outer membrane receptor protein involved in Fe transport